MQFMVQGAWGVIPAHLNELSPPAVRGTFPGFAYQLGNFFSSRNGVMQAKFAEQRYGGIFAPVMAWTVLLVASLVAIVTWSGRERRGADLVGHKLEGANRYSRGCASFGTLAGVARRKDCQRQIPVLR